MIFLLCLMLVTIFVTGASSELALRPHSLEATDLVTSLAAHHNLDHLLWNLVCLLPAGALFERRHGSGTLLSFAIASGITANLAEIAWAPNFNGAIMGASGVACALFGAFSRTNWFTALVSLVLLGYLIYGALLQPDPNIAYFAHLGGFCCGLFWAILPRGESKCPSSIARSRKSS